MKPSLPYLVAMQLLILITQQTATNNNNKIIFQVKAQANDALGSNPGNDNWEWKAANNPENKFCGISYDEAQAFCHLPPQQALPCPNGAEVDCPYSLPCWTITTECTQPPTVSPTVSPTKSPITKISDNPSDHNFCGIGFDNLFDCAIHCPGGSLDECPSGQICYFGTTCDARIQGSVMGATTPNPTKPPVEPEPFPPPAPEPEQSTPATEPATPAAEEEEQEEQEEVTVAEQPPEQEALPGSDGPQQPGKNFCGPTFNEAQENCSRETNCPSGLHDDCPEDEFCWSFIPECDVNEMPTGTPTISHLPTIDPTPPPQTIMPTQPQPTGSPIDKDDMRNFFFCGIDWMDASTRCYKQCLSGHHIECPSDEQCFAQADCKKGVKPQTPPPTVAPTLTPTEMTGTHAPTSSHLPTPFPTMSMAPTEEGKDPTESPTTYSPTYRPTYGTCEGKPCLNPEHCRSPRDFCGPGESYCTEHSTWTPMCEFMTGAPNTAAPTTIWPSSSPSVSNQPSKTKTNEPTGSPTKLSDVIYYLNTESPTVSSSPTTETPPPTEEEFESEAPTIDLDNMVFEPDDARASFFCGTDWNHAITECPHRCPSGESDQCPQGWSCYAFTPCVGIGTLPATEKPTWEPTRQPTPAPTPGPTPTQYGWSVQNENNDSSSPPTVTDWSTSWTNAPTPKPSFSPTQDQCRGMPCEYKGECRSKLGFCGTGIVYCNSQSAWIPNCDPNAELPVRVEVTPTVPLAGGPTASPTPAPTTAWDAWVNSKSSTSDADLEAEEALNTTATNATSEDESEKEDGNSGNDLGWFNSAFGNDEEYETWWKRQSSSAQHISTLLSVFVTVLGFSGALASV